MFIEVLIFCQFHNPAEIHDGNPVAHVPDNAQIVGNEEIRQAEGLLKLFQQIQYLSLDGNIKGRNGFVGDNHLRLQGNRPGNSDALALTAAEFMGIPVNLIPRHPTVSIIWATCSRT